MRPSETPRSASSMAGASSSPNDLVPQRDSRTYQASTTPGTVPANNESLHGSRGVARTANQLLHGLARYVIRRRFESRSALRLRIKDEHGDGRQESNECSAHGKSVSHSE